MYYWYMTYVFLAHACWSYFSKNMRVIQVLAHAAMANRKNDQRTSVPKDSEFGHDLVWARGAWSYFFIAHRAPKCCLIWEQSGP